MENRTANLDFAYENAWPIAEWRDLHVILAVSGGADSVAMLRSALALKRRAGGRGQVFVAHLNHGWRGAESAADAEWVSELCRTLDVPCDIGQADVAAVARHQGDGWESAARQVRYDFLRSTAERRGARFVAVAHTADDQVETVLHRILRGTGVAGLAGMPRVRPLSPTVTLVRPLLAMRRIEVIDYLRTLDQEFRDDVTNIDARFTRNRIRHDLLPLLRAKFNADVDDALLRLAQQAVETQSMIANAAVALVAESVEIVRPTDSNLPALELRILRSPLFGEPPIVVREVCKTVWTDARWPLQDMGFDEWQRLANMALQTGKPKATVFPGGIRGEIEDDALILRR